jgi:glycosyltransferase involved in cell wall biosynthesis
VYPPVDTAFYRPEDDRPPTRSGFLVVSALVPYKRLDVAIDACRQLGAPLTIVGTGPELSRLQAMAGPDVTFLGWRSNEDIRELYRRSAATLLPGVEDFGMVPVEAQACGCPVVALGSGGAAETVIDGETGALVSDPSTEAFAGGLSRVRSRAFEAPALRAHALQFSRDRFLESFQGAVDAAVADRRDSDTAAGRPSGHRREVRPREVSR